jgi:hypothetical protein
MHPEARSFAEEHIRRLKPELVLEFGSLNINGQTRDIPDWEVDWFGIDLQAGPGVDLVANAIGYTHPYRVSMVVCCEVLEHCPDVWGIVSSAADNLHQGGHLLVTCASDPRAPHSAVDGGPLRSGEYYGNVGIGDLISTCERSGLRVMVVGYMEQLGDLYLLAEKC